MDDENDQCGREILRLLNQITRNKFESGLMRFAKLEVQYKILCARDLNCVKSILDRALVHEYAIIYFCSWKCAIC